MPVRSPHNEPDKIYQDLQNLVNAGYSWRQISCFAPYDEIGIPPGTLATIHKTGVIPDRWRVPLGLPATAPAPICPECGIVHVSKRCPRATSPRRDEPAVRIGAVTEAERAAIYSLTPAQRKQALLKAARKPQ